MRENKKVKSLRRAKILYKDFKNAIDFCDELEGLGRTKLRRKKVKVYS